jgi:hypothetical protein
MDGKGTNGAGDLSRQVDAILTSDADDLTKTARMIDLWGIYRQKAITDVAELLRGDREILLVRAQALKELGTATRIAEERAAERDRELSSDRALDAAARRARRKAAEGRQGPTTDGGETTTETGESDDPLQPGAPD